MNGKGKGFANEISSLRDCDTGGGGGSAPPSLFCYRENYRVSYKLCNICFQKSKSTMRVHHVNVQFYSSIYVQDKECLKCHTIHETPFIIEQICLVLSNNKRGNSLG